MQRRPHCTTHRAFTLVELSMSLVIIGLLVGGVLSGQDLIRASTVRSAVSDIDKYNTGAATFHDKYGGVPGDLNVRRAIEFGFSNSGDANATGAAGWRDGNAVIEGGAPGSTNLAGETALFWQDLGHSGLIGGSYTAIGASTTSGQNIPQSRMGEFLPKTRFRENVFHYLYSDAGRNFYYLAAFSSDGAAVMTPTPAMTPLEARGMDEKMDDGFPSTGIVTSMSNFTTLDSGAAAATTVCTVTGGPQNIYNVSMDSATGAAENQVCQIRIRSVF